MADETARLFDASVAIETIIWLPGIQDIQPDCFDDFRGQGSNAEVLEWLPELAPLFSAEDLPETDFFLEALQGRSGFIFLASTPVRRFHDTEMSSYSWGHRWMAWLYADTPMEMAERAIAWAERRADRDRAKSAAATEPSP